MKKIKLVTMSQALWDLLQPELLMKAESHGLKISKIICVQILSLCVLILQKNYRMFV